MRAKIGDVVIDKTYHKNGRLSIVVGKGISQPILLHHRSSITMDKLGDCFSTWEGIEVIGHIDFEKIWAEAVRIADRKTEPTTEDSSTVPTSSKMEQVDEPQTERIKTPDYCDICNHKGCGNCIANNLDDYCVPSGYEPITKTETQNSNLGFEKPQTERKER